jgi:predicted RNase H-like HicB family nuclease
MSTTTYSVRADWDGEAEVWVATSQEVPGLCTEAATLEALAAKLRVMVPELLEANDRSRHTANGVLKQAGIDDRF